MGALVAVKQYDGNMVPMEMTDCGNVLAMAWQSRLDGDASYVMVAWWQPCGNQMDMLWQRATRQDNLLAMLGVNSWKPLSNTDPVP